MSIFDDTAAFREMAGQDRAEAPGFASDEVMDLREKLLSDEFLETMEALEARDFPAFVDGLMDLIYVAAGALDSCGIDPPDSDDLWDIIHAANMTKAGGPKCPKTGKLLKPPGFRHPDVKGYLESCGWRDN